MTHLAPPRPGRPRAASPSHRRAGSPGALVRRLLALPLAAALLSGCASYVEPSPGRYVDLGSRKPSDLVCEYDAPTAMRIPAWTCRRTVDVARDSQNAQDTVQSLPTIQPRDP